jgi:hypothetical protein
MSNVMFTTVFGAFIVEDVTNFSGVAEVSLFRWTMAIWLLNSVINLTVTYVFRDRHSQMSATSPEDAHRTVGHA